MSGEQEGQASEAVRVHAIVRGRVQGVGFRATSRHHAKRLDLTGTVRNRSDGTVEIYVQGPAAQIDPFFAALKGDAGWGQVEAIDHERTQSLKEYEAFSIIF
jgi:acylphosphatase